MLGINMDDVMTTIGILQNYLIALIVFLVLAVVVTIAAIKIQKPLKGLVRGSAWVAFVLALVIIVNMILTGPMYSMVSMVFRPADEISEESITEASALGEEIANEGFVLLKNDGILPLSSGAKLNTFGWSSTAPVYGGTGSGSLSANYPTISLLEGLSNAGIEYNTELTDFYTSWRTERPVIGMFGQDWTVPEPSMAEYDAANFFESAKGYSDTALIVIARSGGEGADLPTSLDPAKETPFTANGWASSGLRYSEYSDDHDASKHYLELSNREKAIELPLVCGRFVSKEKKGQQMRGKVDDLSCQLKGVFRQGHFLKVLHTTLPPIGFRSHTSQSFEQAAKVAYI